MMVISYQKNYKKMKKQTIRLTESELHNIIKETLKDFLNEPSNDLKYLINMCEKYDTDKIKLMFEDVDVELINKIIGNKLTKTNTIDEPIYVAEFVMPNCGYGDKYACVISELEFSGYGVLKNYICDISYNEFCRLLKNFHFDGGVWRRNNTFNY